MTKLTSILALGGLALASIAGAAHADESAFAYTKGADTIPKGEQEITTVVTQRDGKKFGSYTAYDIVAEYERGLTDNLSWGIALGGFNLDYSEDAFAPELEEDGSFEPGEAFSESKVSQIKTNLKYQFLSPYTDGIGFAMQNEVYYQWYYGRVDGAATKQISWEPRLIVQKNYLDDTLILGGNFVAEMEWRCFDGEDGGPDECENEFKFEPSVGMSYRFAPRFSAGFEGLYRTDILNGEYNHGSFFLGPNFHYGDKRWYATATLMWQVAGNPAYSYDTEPQYRDFDINIEEETETEFRFKIGFNL